MEKTSDRKIITAMVGLVDGLPTEGLVQNCWIVWMGNDIFGGGREEGEQDQQLAINFPDDYR